MDPRVDLIFKKIFGVEENKDLLISLLNSIISKEDQIADVTIRNPYNTVNFRKDKLSVLDIKAEGCNGKLFNIEMQISDEGDYDKRALYYWGKLYTDQLKSGENYNQLSKAIGIHILNFTSIPGDKEYHKIFCIKEKTTNAEYFKDLELHTIELNKFTNDLPNTPGVDDNCKKAVLVSHIKDMLDMWVAFLTRHDLLKTCDVPNLDKQLINKAIDVLEVIHLDDIERDEYENRLKWIRIEASTIEKAEARAREEGREKGREEGREEGAGEAVEKMTLNMLKQNIDLKLISSITGLSEGDILELKLKFVDKGIK